MGKHEMILAKKHSSGADEWVCPICGRRILIRWEPKFRRTILESGNSDVAHGGFRIAIPVVGNLTLPFVEGSTSYEYFETVRPDVDESMLSPWVFWMEQTGFENFWGNDPG